MTPSQTSPYFDSSYSFSEAKGRIIDAKLVASHNLQATFGKYYLDKIACMTFDMTVKTLTDWSQYEKDEKDEEQLMTHIRKLARDKEYDIFRLSDYSRSVMHLTREYCTKTTTKS